MRISDWSSDVCSSDLPASTSLLRIARYPVKGLTGQPLDHATLTAGQPLAGDRRFALAHGSSAFDPAAPAFQKKAHFLTWVRNPHLASLHCGFDAGGTRITVADPEPETRSAERRVGNECVSSCRSRWSRVH